MKTLGIFLAAEPGRGGMFQYSLAMLETLAALPREQYRIVTACYDPAWRPYIESLGLSILTVGNSSHQPTTFGRLWRSALLPLGPWRAFLWRSDRIARALHAQQCDLWIFPAQDHYSYLTPVRALVSIHDLMHRYEARFPEVSRGGRYFAREYRFRNICRVAEAVLVDSEFGRGQVMESYGMEGGRLFSLPYIPPRYILSTETPAGFDSRYRLPPRYLFYPAQFWQHKNHARLIEALAVVHRRYPEVALVLAGPKRIEYDNLVRRIAALGLQQNVVFTGYVPDGDLAELYRRAVALVMPTFFGPTNIPPLEAFACGCPVALSNIYGMPEQVGEAALLFDPTSTDDMALTIEKLWSDASLRRRLTALGHEHARRWGQNQFAARLRDILDRLGQ